MTIRNQYSDLIPESFYNEYKKVSPEKRLEMEDEAFRIIRSVNTFPDYISDVEDDMKSLRNLMDVEAGSIYDFEKNHYGYHTAGTGFLYKFFPNIYDVQKQNCDHTIRSAFFDDDYLKKFIQKSLAYGSNIMDLIRWGRMVARVGYVVNFRPAVAKVLYELYSPRDSDSKVLDTSAGYGGRLLGAWAASNVSEYIGIDPNTETALNAGKLITYLDENFPNLKKTEVLCIGSETFTGENYPQYQNYFDIAFTSPPYFNTEVYSTEETQSCNMFNTYDLWVKGFLRPTIHNTIDALKEDGVFSINIFEKVPNIKKIIAFIAHEKGFRLYHEDLMLFRVMPGAGKDGKRKDTSAALGNYEPIWYFKHENVLEDQGIPYVDYMNINKISADNNVNMRRVLLSNGKYVNKNF